MPLPLESPNPQKEVPPPWSKRIPGLDGSSSYIVYYGSWTDSKIEAAWNSRLVIGEFSPHSVTAEQVQKLRAGRDGAQGTSDDVVAIAYLSPMQERDLGNGAHFGDGTGPKQIDQVQGVVGRASGYASYYVDALTQSGSRTKAWKPDGLPDRTDSGTGYRVDPSDALWRAQLQEQSDALIQKQGVDGLFLDVLDAASPGGAYSSLIPAASDLVKWLASLYPQKYLVANRGFYLFESNPRIWYARYNVRAQISVLMLENQYTEWNSHAGRGYWSPWAGYPERTPGLIEQSLRPDGFQILVLDYINPHQSDCEDLVSRQNEAVKRDGNGQWTNLISSIELNQVGFPGCASTTQSP